jgi:thiosulfate/3-mercaptopyruvate sulfurtransferase
MIAADVWMSDHGYATDNVLVDQEWLSQHLHDPALRLVEVDVSSLAYDEGHIEGAVLWNIYRDLKDAGYQLVEKAAIEALVTRSGIGEGSTVVFYGYAPAMGFWLMKLYGHADVRILNCARETWQSAGGPWTREVATPLATSYPLGEPDGQIRADLWTVRGAIEDPGCTILDGRTEPEFRGERFWPSGGLEAGDRAGHIPSAINTAIEDLLDEHGSFRSAAAVSAIIASIDPSDSGQVISYCTIGARACTAWFALTYLLGRENVLVYDGSWAKWGRMPATPVVSLVSQ